MTRDIITLLLRPVPVRETQSGPPQFDATHDRTGQHIVRSHAPLYDGARKLLDGGTLPTVLLTTRHIGNRHNNFRPAPVGTLALLRVTEEGRDGLRQRPFRAGHHIRNRNTK